MNMDTEDFLAEHGSAFDRLADASSSSDIFNRQYGTELARWESELLKQFSEHVHGQKFRYRGFVKHTRDASLVLLTPSPWLFEGEFIFFESGQTIPDDGAYIELIGKRIAAPSMLQQSNTILRAIAAESFQQVSMDFASRITPPLTLKELSDILFERVGMAEASKRVFARLFVSSPPFQNAIGGLTTGIQAIASMTNVRRFLSFVRRVLPPSMRSRSISVQNVRGIKVPTQRIFRVDVGPLSKIRMETICTARKDPSGFKEVSVGALTETETAALPDVPLALASEDFWIETRNPAELRLPIVKSAITYQLLTPVVSQRSIDSSTKHVLSRLEILQESFGLGQRALARGKVLDADALGRPLSSLKIARSTARAAWSEKITATEIKHAWDRILEPALKEFMELTEIKQTSEESWGKGSRIDRFNTKVLRVIRILDTGKRGSLGPTLDEIANEAGVERHVAAETLARMKDSGVLYEPRPGHYRLV
jgi:mRNA-degrading endonuclease toxin of MazEF toxin-antitoxin module